MMWSIHHLGVLILVLTIVQPSDQKALSRVDLLRVALKSRHVRQATDSTDEPVIDFSDEPVTDSFLPSNPATTPYSEPWIVFKDPPPTPGYPPPNRNDACRGCDLGEICVEIYPPCIPFTLPPPPPECLEEEPDPSIDCDTTDYGRWQCDPVSVCVNHRYAHFFY